MNRKRSYLEYGPLGMLQVIRPVRIMIFIVVWIVLMGLTMLLDRGESQIESPGGFAGVTLTGLFMAYSGFAPVISKKIRKKWCVSHEDFEKAKSGLWLIGLLGSAFTIFGMAFFLASVFVDTPS